MESYIALLRGINVSGQKKIKMQDLKVHLTEIGLNNVKSYIQSGNLIIQSEKTAEILTALIEDKIEKEYGFNVPVTILTQKELEDVIENNPFTNKNTKFLNVSFLFEQPEEEHIKALKSYDFDPDEFRINGKQIYIYCPTGNGKTKLNNNFFEKKLKLKATSRNWNTLNELKRLISSI